MKSLVILFAALALLTANVVQGGRPRGGRHSHSHGGADDFGPPEPFEFNYASQDDEGSHSHNQQGDANGRVTGEYTLELADGRSRQVRYYADDTGFHADVVTNELGTESKNPADVTIQSSAPTGAESALRGGGAVGRPGGHGFGHGGGGLRVSQRGPRPHSGRHHG
ncbi:adult-specific rigid cuticular protein 15.5-like [Varroa jacobsoni]|uniref:Uncharacterized protein n=1 Tax=Varroa destructor TaxID=109461 RepID=A0A7M7JKS8_VARDE|nr:adult-specific rigid cuticular protein 15.5-like [Varroa destructor]XP_022707712.1 adult-specific rigid cuticular protein 15.5-like [Varroa jacobsoni]